MQIFLYEHPSAQYLVLLVAVVVGLLPMWFLWRAFKRAGLPAPIAFLALVPGGIFLALGILAFAEWPALRNSPSSRIDRFA
jgi:hypothetical protein